MLHAELTPELAAADGAILNVWKKNLYYQDIMIIRQMLPKLWISFHLKNVTTDLPQSKTLLKIKKNRVTYFDQKH